MTWFWNWILESFGLTFKMLVWRWLDALQFLTPADCTCKPGKRMEVWRDSCHPCARPDWTLYSWVWYSPVPNPCVHLGGKPVDRNSPCLSNMRISYYRKFRYLDLPFCPSRAKCFDSLQQSLLIPFLRFYFLKEWKFRKPFGTSVHTLFKLQDPLKQPCHIF